MEEAKGRVLLIREAEQRQDRTHTVEGDTDSATCQHNKGILTASQTMYCNWLQ